MHRGEGCHSDVPGNQPVLWLKTSILPVSERARHTQLRSRTDIVGLQGFRDRFVADGIARLSNESIASLGEYTDTARAACSSQSG